MFKTNVSNSITLKMASMFKSRSAGRSTRYKSGFIRLENGLGLCLVSFPGIKTVSLRGFVFVGSIYENHQNSGISHFLEHMLFRGNQKLGDAAAMNVKMEELGGEFNAATSFDQTEYWLDIHRDYLEQGIERFCQFLQYPLFEQLEVERSIILEEIIGDFNDENNLVDLDSLTSNLLWPDHPMGMPIIGNIDTVKRIQKTDLIDWHRRFYMPANIIIGITGDIKPETIKEIVGQQFNDALPKQAETYRSVSARPDPGQQLKLVADRDNQFSIQWSFPANTLNKSLRVQYELLHRILDGGNSSRLQRLIREEKGLVYDISLDTTYFNTGMIMSIQSMVGISRLGELVSALVDMVDELIANGLTHHELKMAKLRYRAALECNNDTAQGVLYDSLMPMLHPSGASFDDVFPILSEISLESVNKTLQTLLDQKSTTFVLVGPWTEKERETLSQKLHPWINGKNMS